MLTLPNGDMLSHELKYDRCLLVFVDILGWKDIIEESRKVQSREQANHIYEMFAGVQMLKAAQGRREYLLKSLQIGFEHQFDGLTPTPTDAQTEIRAWHLEALRFKGTQFSDCVFLSAPIDSKVALNELWLALYGMFQYTTHYGMLIRGAIIVGDVVHENSYLFGPGLLDAYSLEQKAKMPRILISDDAIDLVKRTLSVDVKTKIAEDSSRYIDLIDRKTCWNLPRAISIVTEKRKKYVDRSQAAGLDSDEAERFCKVMHKFDWYLHYLNESLVEWGERQPGFIQALESHKRLL